MHNIKSAPLIFLIWILFIIPLPSRAQEDTLRFGLIADPQYADRTSGGRCYSSSLAKIEEAIATFNVEELLFIAVLGDVIDGNGGGDGSQSLIELEAISTRIKAFEGDVYAVMGNHDLVDVNKDEWLNVMEPKIKEKYYSFDAGPFHFVVLDGNYIADGTDYGRDVNWVWTDTWILEEQQNWLIADLDSAGNKPTFVFVHQNLQDNSSISVNNSAEIRGILESHGNVTHVFQGHEHAGQYTQINGIHYVTLKGMVDCPADENRYATVSVAGNTVHVEGHGAQPGYDLQHEGLLEAVWPVKGCTDSTFMEYNPEATVHVQDSCFTVDVVIEVAYSKNHVYVKNSVLYVSIEDNGAHSLGIFNVNGKLVISRNGAGEKDYQISGLEPGMYFIRFVNPESRTLKRFMLF